MLEVNKSGQLSITDSDDDRLVIDKLLDGTLLVVCVDLTSAKRVVVEVTSDERLELIRWLTNPLKETLHDLPST